MATPTVAAKLPSGFKMMDNQLPAMVQEQVRAIALQVLQRLFTPLLLRYRLRKIRGLFQQKLFTTNVSLEKVETVAMSALQYISYLGAVTRDFYTAPEVGRLSSTEAAAAEGAAPPAAMALPSVSATTGAEVRERVRKVLSSNFVSITVHLQGEYLEWEKEPASEVLVLVGGAVVRRGIAVTLTSSGTVGMGSGASPSVCASPIKGKRASTAPELNASRKGSAPTLAIGRPGTGPRGSVGLPPGAGAANSGHIALVRRPSSEWGQDQGISLSGSTNALCSPQMASPTALTVPAVTDSEVLLAPQVLGELACVGSFPYCATLVVSSPMAIVLRIPKPVYCHMVNECVTTGGQRRLLVEALQMRERLLPHFSPLTCARLQICPLLTRLHSEHLDHIRDLIVPRVYAAGMECGEQAQPTHIFFIQRGVVQRQEQAKRGPNLSGGAPGTHSVSGPSSPRASAVSPTALTNFSLSMPKNRSLLVDGHTYGETGCIFGDVGHDRYTAVTHVDMYLLPFQVLIQLMKQVPEVQSTIYQSAQELSYLRDKEWAGTLFGPRLIGTELPGVHGVVLADGNLACMATNARENGGPLGVRAPFEGSSACEPHGAIGATHGNRSDCITPTATRRVTIFEEAATSEAAGGRAGNLTAFSLVGGRVSSALITAIEHLPIVSLLPSVNPEFYRACMQHWQCITYTKGDIIAASGDECSRLLFFFEGRAGIIMDAPLLEDELRPGPFGKPDIASAPVAAVCPIPPGHAVGYTCVRRHRWVRSIVALDEVVEVWEMRRSAFVQLLGDHGMEREMQVAALQVLQPLAAQNERLAVLDYQPLLRPMPSSLWTEQAVPNVHPVVVTLEKKVCFPVWREGDFPFDRHQSMTEFSTHVSSRRATLASLSSVKMAVAGGEAALHH